MQQWEREREREREEEREKEKEKEREGEKEKERENEKDRAKERETTRLLERARELCEESERGNERWIVKHALTEELTHALKQQLSDLLGELKDLREQFQPPQNEQSSFGTPAVQNQPLEVKLQRNTLAASGRDKKIQNLQLVPMGEALIRVSQSDNEPLMELPPLERELVTDVWTKGTHDTVDNIVKLAIAKANREELVHKNVGDLVVRKSRLAKLSGLPTKPLRMLGLSRSMFSTTMGKNRIEQIRSSVLHKVLESGVKLTGEEIDKLKRSIQVRDEGFAEVVVNMDVPADKLDSFLGESLGTDVEVIRGQDCDGNTVILKLSEADTKYILQALTVSRGITDLSALSHVEAVRYVRNAIKTGSSLEVDVQFTNTDASKYKKANLQTWFNDSVCNILMNMEEFLKMKSRTLHIHFSEVIAIEVELPIPQYSDLLSYCKNRSEPEKLITSRSEGRGLLLLNGWRFQSGDSVAEKSNILLQDLYALLERVGFAKESIDIVPIVGHKYIGGWLITGPPEKMSEIQLLLSSSKSNDRWVSPWWHLHQYDCFHLALSCHWAIENAIPLIDALKDKLNLRRPHSIHNPRKC